MKENYSRNRLTEDIRRLLPTVITSNMSDPLFKKHIFTLKDVRTVKGGHMILAFFNMDFSDDKETREIEEKACVILEKSKKFLIGKIAKSLRLKRTPDIRFIVDNEREASKHIDDILSNRDWE